MEIYQISQPIGPTAPTEIRILPAGAFRSADGSGRPEKIAAWVIDAAIAKAVISLSFTAQKDLLIDYDHQSMLSSANGQIAPAAGWFSGLEWRDGLGLYATKINWNERAKNLIAAKEYRFISPVFSFDPNSGVVTRIVSFAITNSPALPDLADLSRLAATSPMPNGNAQTGRNDPRNQRGYELLARMI